MSKSSTLRRIGSLVRFFSFWRACTVLILLSCAIPCFPYSVLTHEEIVDLLWASDIRPLIQKRFPGLTDDQLKEAHAYAYGGSVIQDLGYYPFGSKEFSDLVHYVRSGEFVEELVRQSQNPDEYAFALGAMAHYVADVDGHPAVNQAVALSFPKLKARYGPSVTYAEDHSAHLRTEFGFDTQQVAKERYAPDQYRDFIGFEVSEGLLERAFPVVYGMDLKEVLPHEDLAIGSYRWAISRLIPHMTKVALQLHKKQITTEAPNFSKRKFLYRLSRADYEKSFGKTYRRPGFGTQFLAVILKIIPKVGPFRGLDFKDPTQQTEDLYIKSINKTYDDYRSILRQARNGTPDLQDRDLDTGALTRPAEYSLADETYGKLLTQLAGKQFSQASPELRQDLLQFYQKPAATPRKKKDKEKWLKLQEALNQLKAAPAAPAPAPATGEAGR